MRQWKKQTALNGMENTTGSTGALELLPVNIPLTDGRLNWCMEHNHALGQSITSARIPNASTLLISNLYLQRSIERDTGKRDQNLLTSITDGYVAIVVNAESLRPILLLTKVNAVVVSRNGGLSKGHL